MILIFANQNAMNSWIHSLNQSSKPKSISNSVTVLAYAEDMPLEGYAQTLPELEFCLCRHPYDKAATYSAIVLQDPSENVFGQVFRVEIPPEKVFGALGMVLKGAQLKK